ncbi:MAG: plasmid pRiA4b ORF-3 family protein [Acidobacteria bacterium]|nr:plasmid pRiA4b ORF-3 family protein [Acidobacteriota bacterium]
MTAPRTVYQIKVSLKGSRPPIWRRLLVRDTVSLQVLHELLQFTMGWTDSHLHQFVKGETCYGSPYPEMPEMLDEKRAKLNSVLRKPKDRILYEYDFGDGWLHDVVLERVVDADRKSKYPWLVAGKRACPPEDCGGLYGYYHLLEVLADPDHPEYAEMNDWLGEGFDAEAFDLQGMNRMLHGGWYPSP